MRTCPRLRLLPATVRASALAGAGLLAAASPALAAFADCPDRAVRQAAPPKEVGSIGTAIEGMVVDRSGRLWVTDLIGGRVIRFDRPGAPPKTIATIPGGGGGALELEPDGTVIVGSGADPRVLLGDLLRPGVISRVDPVRGTLTEIARGFSAANGLAVTRDGTIYATNDFAQQVGRRLPDGAVDPAWASIPSANGAAIDSTERYLYVSRTFVNPGVSRISLADPARQESLLDLRGTDVFAAPDGLTLDSRDRPIVPTNVGGEILRLDAPGKACRLAKGLTTSSVVVYGRGTTGFSRGRLFRAGFDGRIVEIPAAYDPGA